jgi:23S rRNA pseudouridine2605 synthase
MSMPNHCRSTRLNAYIAKGTSLSRRAAEKLIAGGAVTINGIVSTKPYLRVTQKDRVAVEGKILKPEGELYLLFHKPKGVTTTLKDKFAEKTIVDCLPGQFRNLFPVGRLDKNSSGLLLLTNDGSACYRLTHPKFMVEKEYLITIRGSLTPLEIRRAKKGVNDDGDILKVRKIEFFKKDLAGTAYRVIVCEGKKRHLRRLFRTLGYDVEDLVRVRIGTLRLGALKNGSYRLVTKAAVYKNILFELKKDKTMVV